MPNKMPNKISKIANLEVHPILDDTKISTKEGCYFPESHYNKVINSNTDVYGITENGTRQLLLKFRKGVIPQSICQAAFQALEAHSNEYDLINDETFNEEATNEERHFETILLDSYYSDKITADIPYNQIHIGNWHSSCSMQDTSIWDNHFQNVFMQYSYLTIK